jgi:aminopeptidase N
MAVIHNNLFEETGRPNSQLAYQKGGWFLHMLRGELGTEKFWTGIREYYKQYRDSNASSDDLRRVMEETSGKDLAWLFEQWLRRAGSPVVNGSWAYNPATKKIEIELSQTQAGELYRLPIEIGFGQRTEKIELRQKQQRFEIAADSEPASVALDPNTWVLMDAKFSKR